MKFDIKGSPISRALVGPGSTYEKTRAAKMRCAVLKKISKKATKTKVTDVALLAFGNNFIEDGQKLEK